MRVYDAVVGALLELGNRIGQLVVVTPLGGGGQLFGGRGGGPRLSGLEQRVADSGVPYLIVRAASSDRVTERYGEEANVVVAGLGGLPANLSASRSQVRPAAAAPRAWPALCCAHAFWPAPHMRPPTWRCPAPQVASAVVAAMSLSRGNAVVEVGASPAAPAEDLRSQVAEALAAGAQAEAETPAPAVPAFFTIGSKKQAPVVEEEEEGELPQAAVAACAPLCGWRRVHTTMCNPGARRAPVQRRSLRLPRSRRSSQSVAARRRRRPLLRRRRVSAAHAVGGTRGRLRCAARRGLEVGDAASSVACARICVHVRAEEAPAPAKKPAFALFGGGGTRKLTRQPAAAEEEEEAPAKPARKPVFSFGTRVVKKAAPVEEEEEEAPAPKRAFAFASTSSRTSRQSVAEEAPPATQRVIRGRKPIAATPEKPAPRAAPKAEAPKAAASKKSGGFLSFLGVSNETIYADEA